MLSFKKPEDAKVKRIFTFFGLCLAILVLILLLVWTSFGIFGPKSLNNCQTSGALTLATPAVARPMSDIQQATIDVHTTSNRRASMATRFSEALLRRR